jgi:type I restriction enzyme S subunit
MSNLSFMEKLLDGVGVEWKELGQVAKIKHGKDWKGLDAGDVPVYGSGGIMRYVDKYSYDKPTVLIPRKGSITNISISKYPFGMSTQFTIQKLMNRRLLRNFFIILLRQLI